MNTCILTANLNSFDRVQEPVKQSVDHEWHCFTDDDFPPVIGLSPRLQYRIPKTHGWQMKPGHEVYIWLDGSITLVREDSVAWLLDQLGSNHMAIFSHPDRTTARQETDYIEKMLQKEHPYIVSRYKGGLHQEQMSAIEDTSYVDDKLFASTAFVYRPTDAVQTMMKEWLYASVRYFTCDQIVLPYLMWKYGLRVREIEMNPFNNPFLKIVSKHK